MNLASVICGDALEQLRLLPDESAHCCVTSPPYWGLRDYQVDGQLGLEDTPGELVAKLVVIFDEVKRVLRRDGTMFLNLGDTYIGGRSGGFGPSSITSGRNHAQAMDAWAACNNGKGKKHREAPGLKPKDMVGLPWRVAFALQDAGWWLRSEIIWHKPCAMPESVKDRPTRDHEHVFLLTRDDDDDEPGHEQVFLMSKERRYYYDQEAIREPAAAKTATVSTTPIKGSGTESRGERVNSWMQANGGRYNSKTRNARTVWTIAQQPRGEQHFAPFPDELARRCILAGCPEGGIVLDPFGGRGTTGVVAARLGRRSILIELNPQYAQMAMENIVNDAPLVNEVQAGPPTPEQLTLENIP